MIGAVDEIGKSGGRNAGDVGGAVGKIAAPEAGEIPVGAGDMSHIDVEHHAELLGSHAGFLNAAIAETKTPAHGADDTVFDFGSTLRWRAFRRREDRHR